MPIIGIIASAGKNKVPTTPTGWVMSTETASAIQRFPFATETYTTLTPTFRVQDPTTGSYSNSTVAGYATGGSASSGTTTGGTGRNTAKWNFKTETISFITNQITYDTAQPFGLTNNGTCGYIVSGMTSSYTTGVSTINKMPYSTETPASITATLGTPRGGRGGIHNVNTAGYVLGGTINQGGTVYTTCSKLAYSNDTTSTLSATLGTRTVSPGTAVYGGISGFIIAGYTNPGDITSVQRLTYSSETTDTPTNVVNNMRENSVMYRETTAAYNNPGTGGSTITQKLTYSNTTISSLAVGDAFNYSYAFSDQGTV